MHPNLIHQSVMRKEEIDIRINFGEIEKEERRWKKKGIGSLDSKLSFIP